MKRILKTIVFVFAGLASMAGNPDRAGGAGSSQLLFNPYARSFGMGGSNTACVRGAEAAYLNIAGLAYTEKTEITFSNQTYLAGTGVLVNNLGLAQKLGENGGVIGIHLMAFDFGSIKTVTYENTDQNLPSYQIQMMNIGFSYAKKFSNSITGGLCARLISEGVADAKANGICFDAGVQYQTSLHKNKKIKKEDFRFGISTRNLGPSLSYFGNGMTFRATIQSTGADRRAMMQADPYNVPALVHIGAAYDMLLDQNPDTYFHKLTLCGDFNYNAFQSNILSMGAEYNFKEQFMVRGAYCYVPDNFSADAYRQPVYGIYGGATLQMPISSSGTALAFDYGYAPTHFFNGIHTIGVRLTIADKK